MSYVQSVEKVLKHKDKIVIFYSPWCAYSNRALDLVRESKLPNKCYNIDSISDGFNKIKERFDSNKDLLNFNTNHKTRPIIFVNGRFIGGYTELKSYIG